MLTPSMGFCVTPFTDAGRNAAHFENGRHDVDAVVPLGPQLPLRRDPLRPGDDHPVASAAEVAGNLFRPLERGIHRPRPTDGDVRLAGRPADLVDPLDGVLQPELDADQAGDLAEGAFQPTFGTRAVVSDDVHDECVVEFTDSCKLSISRGASWSV